MQTLELEASKIGIPVRGEAKKLGRIESLQQRVMGVFDTSLGKRRRIEGERGSYVPLRTVEAAV